MVRVMHNKRIIIKLINSLDVYSEILNMGISGFLQKPFKLYELSKIISETLKK